MKALCVVGSRTNENRYGIASGARVARALQNKGWSVTVVHAMDSAEIADQIARGGFDAVVPVGFGPPCEDGHIFAVARMHGVPCAGPTPSVGGLTQDKSALSRCVDALFVSDPKVRSPKGCWISENISGSFASELVSQFRPPLLVKPNFSGSSDNLSVHVTHNEALSAAQSLLASEGKVLIQELETEIAREVSCTVLDCADGPRFLPIVELRRDDVQVLGIEEKFGVDALGRHIIPARLDVELSKRIENAVLTIRRELGPIGLSRTDILVTFDGTLVILEVNGIPGLLESSIACDAARAAGVSFDDLCLIYAMSAFIKRPEPRVW